MFQDPWENVGPVSNFWQVSNEKNTESRSHPVSGIWQETFHEVKNIARIRAFKGWF
jgi:hypothetical protein